MNKETPIMGSAKKGDGERIAVLEVKVRDHEEDIKHMLAHQETLAKGISGINKTLRGIFWIAVGAGGAVIVQQVGIFEAIKLALF